MRRHRSHTIAGVGLALASALVIALGAAGGIARGGDSPAPAQAEPAPAQASTVQSAGPGRSARADLDGDGALERVELKSGRGGIVILDGDVRYASRAKWWVATATLADADRNGLPEVVALLDGDDGRHLGLIGWHAGEYHERLVSQALPIRPLTMDAHDDPAYGGWVVVLTETTPAPMRRADPDRPPPTTTYRWNGFGFIAIAGEGSRAR